MHPIFSQLCQLYEMIENMNLFEQFRFQGLPLLLLLLLLLPLLPSSPLCFTLQKTQYASVSNEPILPPEQAPLVSINAATTGPLSLQTPHEAIQERLMILPLVLQKPTTSPAHNDAIPMIRPPLIDDQSLESTQQDENQSSQYASALIEAWPQHVSVPIVTVKNAVAQSVATQMVKNTSNAASTAFSAVVKDLRLAFSNPADHSSRVTFDQVYINCRVLSSSIQRIDIMHIVFEFSDTKYHMNYSHVRLMSTCKKHGNASPTQTSLIIHQRSLDLDRRLFVGSVRKGVERKTGHPRNVAKLI
jgi:hypothetical protein